MGTAAMDALKYGSYMSGLYGTMAASSTTSTDPTNTTSNSSGGNKSPYMQQELSPKSYNDKGYPESNNGSSTGTTATAGALKGSNYTADSLSRSYFDASRYSEASKSYTPDSLSGGRASSDSPDAMKQQMQMQQQQNDMQQQQPQQQQQQQAMGFNSLQAYYSQHGMGATSNVTPNAAAAAPGSLPPFLPMAAQLSQYSVAASAAASAAAAANTNYSQGTPPGATNSEYRRPLSVLF